MRKIDADTLITKIEKTLNETRDANKIINLCFLEEMIDSIPTIE